MLVVVHEDNGVGVVRDFLQLLGRGGRGHVDVETQVARMEIGIEFLDEGEIERLGIFIQIFKIERKSVILGEGSEETAQLLSQDLTFGGIL